MAVNEKRGKKTGDNWHAPPRHSVRVKSPAGVRTREVGREWRVRHTRRSTAPAELDGFFFGATDESHETVARSSRSVSRSFSVYGGNAARFTVHGSPRERRRNRRRVPLHSETRRALAWNVGNARNVAGQLFRMRRDPFPQTARSSPLTHTRTLHSIALTLRRTLFRHTYRTSTRRSATRMRVNRVNESKTELNAVRARSRPMEH